ncbi:AAA family ATPase [Candidatus Protofrankia californiensis]|uniref:AAA family ATPase n=1 Tax=Candidatus Protofrankia californiensis TaxID=1839754 RepID=UPI0010414EC4|nr:AAA family ATPase [Candidatus Protofrankia californiensis]
MTSRLFGSPGGYEPGLSSPGAGLRASTSGRDSADAEAGGGDTTDRNTTERDTSALDGSGPTRAGDPAGEGWTLRYPSGTVLVVAGIPGAGKSTLIRRMFGDTTDVRECGQDAGPLVLDSAGVRTALRARFGPRAPYRLYRPAVHTLHYARIAWMTAWHRGDLVVHECGTRRWARQAITGLARLRHRPAHLILIDTPPADALAGQRARGRTVRSRAFRRHEQAWAQLRSADPAALYREGWSSIQIIDRRSARTLTAIRFD